MITKRITDATGNSLLGPVTPVATVARRTQFAAGPERPTSNGGGRSG